MVGRINQWQFLRICGKLLMSGPSVDREDVVEWVLTPTKLYSVNSAWNYIRRKGCGGQFGQKDAIPRCSFIFWLVCKDRMRTKDRLKRRGVVDDGICVLFNEVDEIRKY